MKLDNANEINSFADYRCWYHWHLLNLKSPDNFEIWVKCNYPQIYKIYNDQERLPDVYFLGFNSWSWNNYKDVCKEFMIGFAKYEQR